MKQHIAFYFRSICLVGLMLLVGSCIKEESGLQPEQTGNLRLQLTIGDQEIPLNTKAEGEYNPLEVSTLWIYKVESDGSDGTTEGLIRKYKPADAVPSDLYLAAGRYKIVVEAGSRTEATYVEKTYAGETVFDLAEQETKDVSIACKITNVAVRVEFDATVAQKFDQGYRVYVCASDQFSSDDAANNRVPTLQYVTDTTGFFLLPAGVSNLSWGFSGESSDPQINQNNTRTGLIEQPEGGKQYTLKFKYSKTPDGYLTVAVKVQEYEEVIEDPFVFTPEPAVMGSGFNIDEVTGYYVDPVDFSVASINALSSLKMTLQSTGIAYEILRDGQVVPEAAASGIVYTPTDETNGSLSLTPQFLDQLAGGIQSLDFEVADNASATTRVTARIAVPKPLEIVNQDLWMGKINLSTIVTDPAVTSVAVKYRVQTTDEWTTLEVLKGSDGYTYAVAITDFKPGRTYEYQLLENGAESGSAQTATTEAGVQIPNASFEEWHNNGSFECPYAEGGLEFWGTGNEGSSKGGVNVTTQVADPRPGSSGQYATRLKTTNVLVKKAAGNIFVGAFGGTEGLTNGKVNMGRAFTFTAKPKALRIWYKCTVGSGDKNRVFVCLTNMTKEGCTYHTVNTGKPDETIFDPRDDEFLYTNKLDPSTLEGHIVGYGDLLIEQSQGEWKSVDIPIIYRDQYVAEKPNVLILTASASYRGDYFEGSTDSELYLDDIEFIYE